MRITRLIAALPAATITVTMLTATAPAVAQAAPAVSCAGGQISSLLAPGLIVEPRTQSVSTDAFTHCTGSRITRAKVAFTSSGTGQCAPMGVPDADTAGVITWSDGTTSRFTGTHELMLTGSHATGTITEGRFAGRALDIRGSQVHEPGEAATACFTGSLRHMPADLVSLTVG